MSADEIGKLADLKDRGVLSQSEFDRKKADILAGRNAVAPDLAKSKKSFPIGKIIIALFIVLVIVGVESKNDHSPASASSSQPSGIADPSETTVSSVANAESSADQLKAYMPRDQVAFVKVIEAARTQYAAGINEMAKGAARPTRARALCNALPSRNVTGWVGQVTDLTTNGDGKGVLTLEVGPSISFKTWNNSLSDISDRTLIEPSSKLFSVATALQDGQIVRFGGHLYASSTDCFEEASMSLARSVQDPDFIFSFQTLSGLEKR